MREWPLAIVTTVLIAAWAVLVLVAVWLRL